MITERRIAATGPVRGVARGYLERAGHHEGPGVMIALPGRPAQFLEIYFDDPYRVSDHGEPFVRGPEAVIVGPSSRHRTRLWIAGPVRTFHIAFQPSGFQRLFGLPMRLMADAAAPAGDLGLGALSDLIDTVQRAPDFAARARAAEDWLGRRLALARRDDPVDRAARLLRRSRGLIPVADLAARADLSPRQFQRVFAERVGLSPKLYARTVRFEAVMEARRRGPGRSWTDLAHGFGYFDQSHLLRDAHAFLGAAPAGFEAERPAAVSDFS